MRIPLAVLLINLWVRSASSACLDLSTEGEYESEDCQGVSPCFIGEQLMASLFKEFQPNESDPADCIVCEYDNNCPTGQFCFALGVCTEDFYDEEAFLPCTEDCSACYADFASDGAYVCGCDANKDRCPGDLRCTGLNMYNSGPVPLHFFGVCAPGDVEEKGDGSTPCLSASSTVNVRNKEGAVYVQDLQIGDEIATSNGVFQEIYAFGHLDVYSMGHFLKVETDGESSVATLEISSEHLLFKYDDSLADAVPVRADNIQVGDFIVGPRSGEIVQILSVSNVDKQGLFSPLVQGGSFISGGMKVSSYTAVSEDSQFVRIANFPILSHQMLSDLAVTPIRLLCQAGVKGVCGSRNSEGQFLSVATAYNLSEPVAIVLAVLIMPLSMLEQFMFKVFEGYGIMFMSSFFSLSLCYLCKQCFWKA